MSYILIDGYNLIGVAHKNLEKVRNDVIRKLYSYSKLKEHTITLVFDGWKNGQNIETKMRVGEVNIIYSRLGEKADYVIKKILSKGLKQWIVVSSDRDISEFASRRGFVSITANEFENKLNSIFYGSRYDSISGGEKKTEESMKYDDIYAMPARQKGNSRKLSKKQKNKLRALKKL